MLAANWSLQVSPSVEQSGLVERLSRRRHAVADALAGLPLDEGNPLTAAIHAAVRNGKRLRPRAVVTEFEKTIHDELDLAREAANCSQLRRNFLHSPLMLVPEVYWDWCTREVMVMQRMTGTPIGQVDELKAQGVDIPRLARAEDRPTLPR